MLIGKEMVKSLKPGSTLTLRCKDLPEYNSSYQTAWQARQELGLGKDDLAIRKDSKGLRIEIERLRREES